MQQKLERRLELHKKIYKKFQHRFNTLDSLYHFLVEPYPEEFSINEIKKYWKNFLKSFPETYLNFYLHIPFCKSKCAYCLYYSWVTSKFNSWKLEKYVNYMKKLFEIFSDVFSNKKFTNLYVGGGSPNILSEEQIERLLKNLFLFFSFEKEGQRTFEMNPNLGSLKKLLIVKKFGFNRVSFGIQSTNDQVLKTNRRIQNWEVAKETILTAKKLGFQVNVDLMINLKGDNPQFFHKSLKDVTSLDIDNVTVYTLLPSQNYAKKFLNSSLKDYYRKHPKKIKPYLEILKNAEKEFGFGAKSIEPFHPFKFNFGLSNLGSFYKTNFEQLKQFLYPGEIGGRVCFSTFALGFTARSHIFSQLEYEQFPEYILDPNEKVFEGKRISLKEEMILFILDNLEFSMKIPLDQFKKEFKISLEKAFPLTIQAY